MPIVFSLAVAMTVVVEHYVLKQRDHVTRRLLTTINVLYLSTTVMFLDVRGTGQRFVSAILPSIPEIGTYNATAHYLFFTRTLLQVRLAKANC